MGARSFWATSGSDRVKKCMELPSPSSRSFCPVHFWVYYQAYCNCDCLVVPGSGFPFWGPNPVQPSRADAAIPMGFKLQPVMGGTTTWKLPQIKADLCPRLMDWYCFTLPRITKSPSLWKVWLSAESRGRACTLCSLPLACLMYAVLLTPTGPLSSLTFLGHLLGPGRNFYVHLIDGYFLPNPDCWASLFLFLISLTSWSLSLVKSAGLKAGDGHFSMHLEFSKGRGNPLPLRSSPGVWPTSCPMYGLQALPTQ